LKFKIYILVLILCSLLFVPKVRGENEQFMYYWYAAKQAIEEERYPEAYVLLEFCHALNPNDGQTLRYLGVVANGLGQDKQAKEYYRKAYEADPQGQWERWLPLLFEAYLDKEQFKKALAVLDEMEQRSGEYSATLAISRYRVYASWDKPKKALEAVDRYLVSDPTNLRFLLFRIEILEHMNAKAKVLYPAYEDVLAINPRHLLVLNNYAYHLATHKGDLVKAERMSELTIREDPTNPVYLDTYGWILHLRGKDELAKFFLERAMSNATDERTREEVQKHLLKVIK